VRVHTCIDIVFAMPRLRSYTRSVTGKLPLSSSPIAVLWAPRVSRREQQQRTEHAPPSRAERDKKLRLQSKVVIDSVAENQGKRQSIA
jgi:hypothetical protein